MDVAGVASPKVAVRASSWGTWGRQLTAPRLGCVLVFTRAGGGHVGFYVGEDNTAYHVLGGNQGNSVSVTRLEKSRLSPGGMRWPTEVTLPPAKVIRRNANNLAISTNEA